MLQWLKDYSKCAVKNKFVLGGYITLISSFAMSYVESRTGIKYPVSSDILFTTGSLSLLIARFGVETYLAYTRTKKHINEFGTIDKRFGNRFLSGSYCTQAGIRLAAKDAGLEHKLGK